MINKGPLAASSRGSHICVLVGYKTIKEGDVLKYLFDDDGDPHTNAIHVDLVVPNGHPLIGRTAWIFKEGSGFNYGENGYITVVSPEGGLLFDKYFYSFNVENASHSGMGHYTWPLCVDEDGDGYYNWGIGPKPDNPDIPDMEDCNDNDPLRLYYDEYYFCTYDCEHIADLQDDSPLIIENDETLYSQLLTKPIKVTNNSTLTLIGEFQCSENVYIESEIGSTIVLDGASFFVVCGQYWKGFKINSNLDPDYSSVGRSMIISKNSEIQDAHCAISGDAGSIIRATDTYFIDNYSDIIIAPHIHTNYYTYVYDNNNSTFNNCTFYTSQYAHNNNLGAHVRLLYSKNIVFSSCKFIDEGVMGAEFSHLNRTGIKSYKTSFSLLDNEFHNMGRAVKAINSMVLPIDITGNTVMDCHYGLYLLNSHAAKILDNDIIFDDANCQVTEADVLPYGVYLDNCNDFHIENNRIKVLYGDYFTDQVCGIVVNDAGGDNNRIYRNRVYGMLSATQAIGINRDADDISNGLQVLCNDFMKNYTDVFVTNNLDNPYPEFSPIGIAFNQGSLTYPAGNKFTNFGPDNYYNLSNDANYYNYYSHNPLSTSREVVPDYYSETINVIISDIEWGSRACPDMIADTETNPIVTINSLLSIKNDIDNKTNVIDFIVDGGNTDMTVSEIIFASEAYAWATYMDLISKSPYLSKKSLKEIAIKEYGFTVPMIRDILVKNPQAIKDPEIKKILKERTDALPDYMMEQIDAGLKQVSPIEYLEGQRASLVNEFYFQSAMLLQYYLRNPDTYAITDIENLFDILPTAYSEIKLSEYYAMNGELSQAKDLLSSIQVDNKYLQAEISDLIELYALFQTLEENNLNILEPNGETFKYLLSFVDRGGKAGSFARGVLLWNNAVSYKEPVFIPSKIDLENRNSTTQLPVFDETVFSVYPNPATDFIQVEYELPVTVKNISLQIFNTQGKVLKNYRFEYNRDIKIISLLDLQPGAYIIRLIADGNCFGKALISKTN